MCERQVLIKYDEFGGCQYVVLSNRERPSKLSGLSAHDIRPKYRLPMLYIASPPPTDRGRDASWLGIRSVRTFSPSCMLLYGTDDQVKWYRRSCLRYHKVARYLVTCGAGGRRSSMASCCHVRTSAPPPSLAGTKQGLLVQALDDDKLR